MPRLTCRMLLAVVLMAAVAAVMLAGCPPKPKEMPEPEPPALTPENSNAAEGTTAAGGPTLKVCISSRPGQLNLDERVRGYQETLKKEFPQIEVIQVIDDETKYSVGQQKASAVLSAHPDLAGFAGVNAASGPGIAAAVTAAGKSGQIVIVAMDADSAILDQIQKGVITSSVAQRQYFMTYIAVKYLYGLVHNYFRKPGDTANASLPEVPQIIDTGTVEVNAQNVAQFRTPSQGAKEELDAKHPDWKKLLSDRKPGEARADEEYVAIGISTGVEYWNAAKAGLDDVAKELGVKGTFTGPQDQNPEQQANTMDQIIARKPAGILIAPGNPDTLLPYINKAIEAGIPVICFDTDAPKSKRIAYFGTENYQAGCTGARILGKALLAKAGK